MRCKKHTGNVNENVVRAKNNRIMLTASCAVCGSRKNKFVKGQEAKGLLSSLGLRTPLNNIPLLGPLLF